MMSDSNLDSLEKELRDLPIIAKELLRLRKGLPNNLKYHSHLHIEDVIHESLLFGLYDKLKERDLRLLAIAATFHDSGFLVKPHANEGIGADFAAIAMEESCEYSKEEILLVSQMIKDTEISWEASGPKFYTNTYLSGYLLDADLSNLGREDFFDKSKLIVLETNQSTTDLRETLINLMKHHKWHTKAAYRLREEQKKKNLECLYRSVG